MITAQWQHLLADWMEIRPTGTTKRWRGQLLTLFFLGSLFVLIAVLSINTVLWLISFGERLALVYPDGCGQHRVNLRALVD